MTKLLQCPNCGFLYSAITTTEANKLLTENQQFFKTLASEHRRTYLGNYKRIDQFKFCRTCGTSAKNFTTDIDIFSYSSLNIFPIIY